MFGLVLGQLEQHGLEVGDLPGDLPGERSWVEALAVGEQLACCPAVRTPALRPQAVTFLAVSLLAGRLAPHFGRRVLELGPVPATLGFAATVTVAALTGSSLSPDYSSRG